VIRPRVLVVALIGGMFFGGVLPRFRSVAADAG
jgi:hypothetical protein